MRCTITLLSLVSLGFNVLPIQSAAVPIAGLAHAERSISHVGISDMIEKRHEYTVDDDEVLTKRHEYTVDDDEVLTKRHEYTVDDDEVASV
jgi:hypothetical protein